MNIFFLSNDPKESARMLCDKHVVKMILELCQMLWTAFHLTGFKHKNFTWLDTVPPEIDIFKATHINHPMCIWVRSSKANYTWASEHCLEIALEYKRRYNKTHKCEKMAYWFTENELECTETNISKKHNYAFLNLQCTYVSITISDSIYHVKKDGKYDLIESYRAYYKGDKKRFAKWKNGNVPFWF